MKNNGFVDIPYSILGSPIFQGLTGSACVLYIHMKAEADVYQSVDHLEFSHADLAHMPKATYYRSVKKLVEAGLIRVVESLGHGKKGVYDLTCDNWTGGG